MGAAIQVEVQESTTVDLLLKASGGSPLLSLVELATVLKRTPAGLRFTLGSDNELARRLLPAKKRVGRRVFFRVHDIARFLDEDDA
ncbi:MAG: DNA-binding protein [Lysobacter sp.]